MQHIEHRIEIEERQARNARARGDAAHDAWARQQQRHITCHDDRGMHLTIRGLSWKPGVGWLLAIFGGAFVAIWFGISSAAASAGVESSFLVVVGLALVVASIPMIASPRSTIRLFATPAGFAVYTRSIDRPHYVGRNESLTVAPYTWQGRTGVRIRVWNTKYWEQTYMSISHPDDFTAIATFNAARGRS